MTDRRVVYVTYDGLNEQLGQSQILPYLSGLAKRGHEFEILSFEKPGSPLCYRKRLAPGIRWTALRYHKRPTVPATLFDVAQGFGAVALESILNRADLLHVRSYVPCTMALGWTKATGLPLLFDMRGLWADERVEAGTWAMNGRLYRGVKDVERVLFRNADAITTLTVRLQRYLRDEYPFRSEIRGSIRVIPTCVDLEHFTPQVEPDPRLRKELADNRVLLYLGAIGSYYLPQKMGEFYLAWRRHAHPARLLVVSKQDPGEIRAVLTEAGLAHELIHRSATRAEVPSLIRCAEASFGLYGARDLAAHGTAATKTGETLACGIPFASSAAGDVPIQFAGSPCGVVVPDTRPETLDSAARELALKACAPGVADHARRLAETWYSLAAGIDAYDLLYRSLPRRHLDASQVADRAWPTAVRFADAATGDS